MADAVFTAINPAGGTVTYSDGSVLTYATTGKYCVELKPGIIERDVEAIYTAGVSGAGTKDYNFRGQNVRLKVTYVESSEANCISAWQADVATIAKVCTLVAGGVTFNACLNQRGTEAEQPKSTGLGSTYRMDAMIYVRATRES